MKKKSFINLLIITACAFIVSSCSEDWTVENDEFTEYIKLYLPKAESDQITTLIMDERMTSVYEESYSVFLGGPNDASKNITATFTIDNQEVSNFNEKNNTNYQLLPDYLYELSSNQVTILNGERGSESITVRIIPSLELQAGEYILPVSIISSDANVNTTLSTVYFIIRVPEDEPEVPDEPGSPDKVLSLGTNWGDIISVGPDDILYIRDTDNVMWVYKPDSEGVYSIAATPFPGDPWNASGWFYYIKDNIEFVVNDDGFYGMFRFDIDPETYFLTAKETVNPEDPWPNNFGFWYGDGWHKFNLIPLGEFIFFHNRENKDLMRVPMDQFLDPVPGTWHKPGWYEDENNIIESDFNYKQVVSFGDYLMGLRVDGTLWVYHVSAEGELDEPKQIGSGWDKYTHIVALSNNVLIAMDNNGDIFRYVIDLEEVYNIGGTEN